MKRLFIVFPLTVYNISPLYLSGKRAGEDEEVAKCDRHRVSSHHPVFLS